MHKVKTITVERFRRLHNIEIEMRPLMVMIGSNGAGKTSMLDAISLLSASAGGNLNRALSDMSGMADVLTRGDNGALILGTEMEDDGHESLEYRLEIEPKGLTYTISQEILSQGKGQTQPFKHIDANYDNILYYNPETKNLARPTWSHNPLESSLSQVPKMFHEPEDLRKALISVIQYHALDVSKRAPVKLPQQMKSAWLPGDDGQDLVPFLYSLRESDKSRYESIEDTLKAAFPGFESLNFPPVATGMLSMTWKERNFKTPMSMHQLSEGTLRFIWLVSLLQSPPNATITMIDEPEVSLHPELLSLFADLLREASANTQIIVATHSDRLIRFLDPKEVLVVDIDEQGYTVPAWADSLDLDKWLADYSLDEVWHMGRMGGRS